jgi:hypothetical protein
MTTLTDRPKTALLVIDVQNGVMAGALERDRVVANIGTLVDKARAAGVPVVWVQHHSDELPSGSEPWSYVPELVRRDTEPLVHKAYGDSFEDTDLAHHRGPVGVRRAAAGSGDRPHQPLLAVHDRAGPHRRDDHHGGGRHAPRLARSPAGTGGAS